MAGLAVRTPLPHTPDTPYRSGALGAPHHRGIELASVPSRQMKPRPCEVPRGGSSALPPARYAPGPPFRAQMRRYAPPCAVRPRQWRTRPRQARAPPGGTRCVQGSLVPIPFLGTGDSSSEVPPADCAHSNGREHDPNPRTRASADQPRSGTKHEDRKDRDRLRGHRPGKPYEEQAILRSPAAVQWGTAADVRPRFQCGGKALSGMGLLSFALRILHDDQMGGALFDVDAAHLVRLPVLLRPPVRRTPLLTTSPLARTTERALQPLADSALVQDGGAITVIVSGSHRAPATRPSQLLIMRHPDRYTPQALYIARAVLMGHAMLLHHS